MLGFATKKRKIFSQQKNRVSRLLTAKDTLVDFSLPAVFLCSIRTKIEVKCQ